MSLKLSAVRTTSLVKRPVVVVVTPIPVANIVFSLTALIKSFDLPLTNRITFKDDHTVDAPTYFWQVKNGKFQVIGKS